MRKLTGPIDNLKKISNFLEGKTLLPDVFEMAGIFLVKNLFSTNKINNYLQNFYKYSGYKNTPRNRFNPVELNTDNDLLKKIIREPELLREVKKIYGPNIALYNFRFVVKDEVNAGPVFLHNDISYHQGYLNRLSAFVAFTDMNITNGGLKFYLGTHKFGSLADAGELNVDLLPDDWPTITPSVKAGDVIFMNSGLWHCSGENTSLAERILADIHYQPSDDPSSIELLAGEWKTDYRIPRDLSNKLFKRCRVSRLKELESEVSSLKDQLSQRL